MIGEDGRGLAVDPGGVGLAGGQDPLGRPLPTEGPDYGNSVRVPEEIDRQRARPSNLYAAEDDAREVTEQLSRDAGYDPISVGGLDQARALEEHLGLVVAVTQGGLGPFFYRYAKPGEL